MSVQQFCLRWNNHQPNFIAVCSSLLHNGTLVDVTLAAEGRQLQAHKIVLSACSSYFQTLFTSNPCQHPIVILKDVQYDDLKTMVDFMYYGEVNVSQEQLPHILKTAEMLKIKGLAEMPTDPANLTKSDNKSSNDHTELIGSTGANVAQDLVSGGGGGGGISGGGGGVSVSDSLWGTAESQFQQQPQQQPQQQQQQQQHQQHHQQQQQQQHQQQQQTQHHHQQQQQQHHHHHQQQQQQQQHHQQQSSQTQTTQHHQLRRTPSPPGAVASPATRRKRIRKSSNNGNFAINPSLTCQFKTCFKGERINPEDQHNTSIDPNSAAGGITLSQMSQMSFAANAGAAGAGTLAGLGGHTLHTAKLLKEAASADLETHPQDSDSLDEQHGHMHMQIKPEVDMGSVQQSIPLDISAATTPSEHDAPNSQSAHSDELPLTTDVATGNTTLPSASTSLQLPLGIKRNRILTRQPRVKRDSDTVANNRTSPDPVSEQTALLEPETYSISSYNPDTSQYHRTKLVTRSARIERHASEPTPSVTTPTSSNLLNVPASTPAPQLIKQHSDPLVRNEAKQEYLSLTTINTTDNPSDINNSNINNYSLSSLQRQYSQPISVTSHPCNTGSDVGFGAGTSLYHSYQAPPSEQAYSSTSCISPPSMPPTTNERGEITTSSAKYIVTSETNTDLDTGTYITIERLSPITHTEATYPAPSSSTTAPTLPTKSSSKRAAEGGENFPHPKLKSSKSASAAESSNPTFERRLPTLPTLPKLPTMRMKCEELQRSLSSPQTSRELITLENPRSSHCPVIRPGPALGCNFCWNTIDGHNRILRRKTKYHCPECQTNLCIVPCFQEYHERLNNEAEQPSKSKSSLTTSNDNQKSSSTTTTSSTGGSKSRNQASKQEST